MTIKYLVIGGGGGGGYSIYGAMKYLCKENFWNINDIKIIYATSIGALISVFISLKYDWESLDDYLIKRPWDKVISLKPMNVLNILSKKGMFDIDLIKDVLNPLLTAKELSESITLKEFYEYNNIEIHMYTVNINESLPTKVDLSYKTHPDLELYKAVAMSSAFPIIFSPIYDGSGCYIDGGVLNNFPLNDTINNCINENNNSDEILAFKVSSKHKIPNIINNSTLINYIYSLMDGLRKLVSTENYQREIKNIVECKLDSNYFYDWKEAVVSETTRTNMINIGMKYGEEFMNK
uniref:PNPLA domain-containing protein n=1 Tax=viral metagenome TaxID=1070528 RepID=A0A6C0AYF0_9ZZZZ|tara:strand:- start:2602 stop:3480 length:879 start_codon:yes stop_codon:yes gene_type:complete